ncbi:transposase domain-containing protein [Paraburkholderia sp. CI3]|uniref:transposase domain-containing protein n=1 Tax=Paraburkholderia sp. CI3 TaxID=2991060 RepID=UPI003D205354
MIRADQVEQSDATHSPRTTGFYCFRSRRFTSKQPTSHSGSGARPVRTRPSSCKANGIDRYRYLTWLFQRLPSAKSVDDYDALLPMEEAR